MKEKRKEERARNRRCAACRRRCITGLAVFVGLCLLFATLGSKVQAGAPDEERVKCYRSVRISEGDTIWSIAEENLSPEYRDASELVREIRKINHVGSDIRSGAYLVVPYYAVAGQGG